MARKLLAVLSVAVLLLAVVPLAVTAQSAELETVCLVTDVGKINDGTFNQSGYEGMIQAADEFGLDTTYIETQATTDFATNIDTCVGEGYGAIVTVGFFLGDATKAAAEANPNIFFIGIDQDFAASPLPNLVGIQFREDQAGFLVGAEAALMSKSGIIGGVYGISVPAVVKYRNGYEQGAKYINPDIQTFGVYIDSFVAPDRGASAAEQFIGEGADVIFGAGGPTGSGGITRAAQLDTYVIGVDVDEYNTTFGGGETPGSEYLITSAIKRVDAGVYTMIKALVDGEGWPTDSVFVLTVANGGITFAEPHDSDVPQDVVDQVTAIQDGLIDGSIETGVDPVSGNLIGSDATPEPMATAEASS